MHEIVEIFFIIVHYDIMKLWSVEKNVNGTWKSHFKNDNFAKCMQFCRENGCIIDGTNTRLVKVLVDSSGESTKILKVVEKVFAYFLMQNDCGDWIHRYEEYKPIVLYSVKNHIRTTF